MTIIEAPRRTATTPTGTATEKTILDVAAVTRLLEAEGILDYSGHVSARIPGRDAFVIQIRSTSRATTTARCLKATASRQANCRSIPRFSARGPTSSRSCTHTWNSRLPSP